MLMLLLSEVSNNALVFIFVAFFKVQVQMSIRTIIFCKEFFVDMPFTYFTPIVERSVFDLRSSKGVIE